MRLYILGICGTFMGSLALIARQQGHEVGGADQGMYPPMSTQLEEQGVACHDGYAPAHLLAFQPDVVIVGNAMSRGNPALEAVLDAGLPYVSGPQWLADQVLQGRHVLAVAGTHGKTTTTSMLAWILEEAGLQPDFLIGGVAQNFGVSARCGDSRYFVIEADEYDTAFFDKRSKFVHYRPRTLILNNLEYDHADIFPDLAAIQRQFHHLVRTVPRTGKIIHNATDTALDAVLAQGCWSARERFGAAGEWQLDAANQDFSQFAVNGQPVNWPLAGRHNAHNALAAIAAAATVGVPVATACAALGRFQNVKRRLEVRGTVNDITVYDDFAHHPTAIAVTLDALRRRVGAAARIIAILEPRSNTMRLGVHNETLLSSLSTANLVLIYQPPDWRLAETGTAQVFQQVQDIVAYVAANARPGDHILIMSNGGFENIHQRVLAVL